MTFHEATNPFRLLVNVFENDILLQIEDDEKMITVTKFKRNNRAKSKATVLYQGSPEDFALNNDGDVLLGYLDFRTALKNFIFNNKYYE